MFTYRRREILQVPRSTEEKNSRIIVWNEPRVWERSVQLMVSSRWTFFHHCGRCLVHNAHFARRRLTRKPARSCITGLAFARVVCG